jgi:glycine cleavage system H protein
MAETKFTREHEWISVDGDVGTVGITDYAQEQLGDIVFVDLPEVGSHIERGKEVAVIESVKAASEVYAPVGGEIIEVNARLSEQPATVNAEPMGGGWFFKVRITNADDLADLMTAAAYKEYLGSLD